MDWTVALQAPLSVGLPRQEHWSGLPFPPLTDLLGPRSNPSLLPWKEDSLRLSPLGSPEEIRGTYAAPQATSSHPTDNLVNQDIHQGGKIVRPVLVSNILGFYHNRRWVNDLSFNSLYANSFRRLFNIYRSLKSSSMLILALGIFTSLLLDV